MNFDIYDKKRIGKKTWYLAKSNLASYMQCLKENFFNFEIQRRIVKNVYLDGAHNVDGMRAFIETARSIVRVNPSIESFSFNNSYSSFATL